MHEHMMCLWRLSLMYAGEERAMTKETAMGVSPQKNKFINKQANNLVEKLPFHDIHTYIYKFINKQE